jgi:hypothetical protein
MRVAGVNSAIDYAGTLPSALWPSEVPKRLKPYSSLITCAELSASFRHCLRDLIRPMSVFLIVLAAAVALWGFAYKLSLYEPPQNHPSHLSVAKMWLGPERQPGLITSHATKPHSWSVPSPQSDLTIGTMPPIHGWQFRWPLSEAVPPRTESSFLVGSRSPPSRVQSVRSWVVA